uniref:xylosyltransferase isoform X1 n=1 Tax=Ciona intestinalis TaxID=7719 RepID=UPI00089DADA0|nr:xylosyltransferase isoform X1 [Ciona intestinalis]|eukprot:XP_018673371.1 xylosyltransferase isoform X1 [Ciona intestinalis]
MSLHRTLRRFLRKWKALVYAVSFILLIQAFFTFQSSPNLMEEEHLRRLKELQIKKHQELANSMLQGERALVHGRDKLVLNPRDPGFREEFFKHSNNEINILEDHNIGQVDKMEKPVLKPNENKFEEIHFATEKVPEIIVKYQPKCDITIKDSISALSRATTDRCKQQIADAACKMQDGTLFPKSMPRTCKHESKFTFDAPMPTSFDPDIRPVRICYMLVVHGRAIRQLRRLLKVIYHRDHYYYIHVDKRSDYLLREVLKETEQYPNIKVAPWRMATIWGGSSLLQTLLRAISDVLRIWKDWDFFINLSALDFPIEKDEKLVQYLSKYRDKNFMKSHGREDEKFIRKQGLNRVFVECDQHMWRLGERQLPEGITVNGGSDWVALNRRLCDFAVNGNDQLLTQLKHWYEYTLLPAESFFHTLVQNSDLCETFVDNNIRVTNWNRARGCKCQYKHIVDWCGCSPNDFYPSDLVRLRTSRPVFFARKFEESINQEVVNHLDFKLYGDYPPGTPALHSLWENVYDYLDGPQSIPDSSLTYFTSFARVGLSHLNEQLTNQALRVNSKMPSDCNLSVVSMLQVEMHKKDEEFVGYVVTFDAGWVGRRGAGDDPATSEDGSRVQLQAFLSPQPSLRILDRSSNLAKRLETASVGTNWDVKELVIRDWGGLVGPNSDVHLVARWSRSEDDFVVTVVVIDPLNVVADYNDFRTPSKAAGVTETPLSLKKPLRPGRWLVRFYVQRQFTNICAELDFYVTPQEFKGGIEGDSVLREINRGVVDDAQVNAANRNLYSIRTTLNLARNNQAETELASESNHVAGLKLRNWVDFVVSSGWKAKDACLVAQSPETWREAQPRRCFMPRQGTPNLCENTNWSSLSPDPKTELISVKPDGRIR